MSASLSLTSPRYEVEAAIALNSFPVEEVRKNNPNWFTVVAQFSNSKGERGWSTINTQTANGDTLIFAAASHDLAGTLAEIMSADTGLPAYVRPVRESAIGLPEGDSPHWDYAKAAWKSKRR